MEIIKLETSEEEWYWILLLRFPTLRFPGFSYRIVAHSGALNTQSYAAPGRQSHMETIEIIKLKPRYGQQSYMKTDEIIKLEISEEELTSILLLKSPTL